jgi:hypothetical protein
VALVAVLDEYRADLLLEEFKLTGGKLRPGVVRQPGEAAQADDAGEK